MKAEFLGSFDTRTSSMQGQVGMGIGGSLGFMFENRYVGSIAIWSNVTLDNLNYGFVGLHVEYIEDEGRAIHWSGSLLMAAAGVKEYVRPKSSLFDDFGNVSGASFFFIEPSANIELNFTESTTIITGLGYRLAFGIDSNSPHVVNRHPTNSDLSGITWNLRLRFR